MTAPAAIAGSFADYRLVKSRGCLQLVIEIPVERQAEAFAALGYPVPGSDIHVAVARMKSPAGPSTPDRKGTVLADGNGPLNQSHPKPAGDTQRQRYAAMSEGEKAMARAGALAGDERFRHWAGAFNADDAAAYIRETCCNGQSRRLIAERADYLERFLAMETDFKIAIGEAAEPR
jgi:hypothetical protein